ncbi:hypothetical protein MPER_06586 [Moniliophthora perniciosa FA553]|nr:hypothetical protein MPER_06586 [Moniliophthora perniciosa FA553]
MEPDIGCGQEFGSSVWGAESFLDINQYIMANNVNDNPPSYDLATGNHHDGQYLNIIKALHNPHSTPPRTLKTAVTDVKKDQTPSPPVPSMQSPSYPQPGPSYTPHDIIYHYTDPQTGHPVTFTLPPNHPEMICLQSGHITETKFGVLGILAAVFWFPLGVGLCLLDRRVKCSRCGHILNDGLCG